MTERKRDLTPKQARYVKHRSVGRGRDQSALLAGYGEGTKDPQNTRIEASPAVKQELARIRTELAKNMKVTRQQVAEMFMEAYGMAKTLADPQGMVAAARELGKMLGHYAPDKTLGLDKNDILKAMDTMSDEELYRLAHAREKIIDGEFEKMQVVRESGPVRGDGEPGVHEVPAEDSEAGAGDPGEGGSGAQTEENAPAGAEEARQEAV